MYTLVGWGHSSVEILCFNLGGKAASLWRVYNGVRHQISRADVPRGHYRSSNGDLSLAQDDLWSDDEPQSAKNNSNKSSQATV